MHSFFRSLISGSIARNTLKTSVVLVIRLFVQTGNLLLLSNLLGPNQYGLYAGLASLALLLGTLASFGLNMTFLRDLSKDWNIRSEILPHILGTTSFYTCALLTIYIIISMRIFSLSSQGYLFMIFVGIAEIAFQPFLVLSTSERQAQERTATSQAYIVLPLFIRLGIAGYLFWTRPENALALYSIGYAASVLLSLSISLAKMKEKWPSPLEWRIQKKHALKENISYTLLGVTDRASGELDKVLGTQLLSAFYAGHYAAASRVIGAFTTPISALVIASLPRLFRSAETRLSNIPQWIFLFSLGYGILAGAGLYFSSDAIARLFGEQYPKINIFLCYLSMALPARCLNLSGCNIVVSMGRPALRMAAELSGILIFIISVILLAPKLPILSFPLSYAISEYCSGAFSWTIIFYNKKNRTKQKH